MPNNYTHTYTQRDDTQNCQQPVNSQTNQKEHAGCRNGAGVWRYPPRVKICHSAAGSQGD